MIAIFISIVFFPYFCPIPFPFGPISPIDWFSWWLQRGRESAYLRDHLPEAFRRAIAEFNSADMELYHQGQELGNAEKGFNIFRQSPDFLCCFSHRLVTPNLQLHRAYFNLHLTGVMSYGTCTEWSIRCFSGLESRCRSGTILPASDPGAEESPATGQ